ncbi:MAG: Cu(I)-responsive transcriptional regulator [Myxococcales bacterium]|nr:Cu(I)-responsive transcriptional regulator [Myxococcales bacterium]
MKIGALADATGVSAKTIRYYEQSGLIKKPTREHNGYRVYSQRDVEILRFVHRARELGFSVADVSELLDLWRNRRRASGDVKALAQKHLDEIEARIAKLESIRSTLEHLVHCCHGDARPDCPILDKLAGIGDQGDS